jgi:hypothetical protein
MLLILGLAAAAGRHAPREMSALTLERSVDSILANIEHDLEREKALAALNAAWTAAMDKSREVLKDVENSAYSTLSGAASVTKGIMDAGEGDVKKLAAQLSTWATALIPSADKVAEYLATSSRLGTRPPPLPTSTSAAAMPAEFKRLKDGVETLLAPGSDVHNALADAMAVVKGWFAEQPRVKNIISLEREEERSGGGDKAKLGAANAEVLKDIVTGKLELSSMDEVWSAIIKSTGTRPSNFGMSKLMELEREDEAGDLDESAGELERNAFWDALEKYRRGACPSVSGAPDPECAACFGAFIGAGSAGGTWGGHGAVTIGYCFGTATETATNQWMMYELAGGPSVGVQSGFDLVIGPFVSIAQGMDSGLQVGLQGGLAGAFGVGGGLSGFVGATWDFEKQNTGTFADGALSKLWPPHLPIFSGHTGEIGGGIVNGAEVAVELCFAIGWASMFSTPQVSNIISL